MYNILTATLLPESTIPMQHDGIYALMSWRDLSLARQEAAPSRGWLLVFLLALWLPLLLWA